MSPKNYRPFPQYVPADGQEVWAVRYIRGADAVAATWDATVGGWNCDDFQTEVPDYVMVEWRPRTP